MSPLEKFQVENYHEKSGVGWGLDAVRFSKATESLFTSISSPNRRKKLLNSPFSSNHTTCVATLMVKDQCERYKVFLHKGHWMKDEIRNDGGSLQEPRPWSPKATQFHKMPQRSYWIFSTRKTTDKCVIDAEICLTCLWSSESLQGENNSWWITLSKQAVLRIRGSGKEGFFLFLEKGSLPRSRGPKDKDYESDTKQKRSPHMKRARGSMRQGYGPGMLSIWIHIPRLTSRDWNLSLLPF